MKSIIQKLSNSPSLTVSIVGVILGFIVFFVVYRKTRRPNQYVQDQLALSDYLNASLSSSEIGQLYERYLGYIATIGGYEVIYNGAVNTFKDFGRDLILENEEEIVLVQAKCWAKHKTIHEKHIFQLYGSLVHYKKTNLKENKPVKALFCTTAGYSDTAISVAKVLGVELKEELLSKEFPMIKCIVLDDKSKTYVLPFDEGYDQISIDLERGESFASSIAEAVAKGFDPYTVAKVA